MEVFFHTITDVAVFIQWFFANLKVIFTSLLSLANYIFLVIGHFLSSAFLTPPAPDFTYTFSAEILGVFNTIPHWAIFTSILGAVIIFAGGVAVLKLFLHT